VKSSKIIFAILISGGLILGVFIGSSMFLNQQNQPLTYLLFLNRGEGEPTLDLTVNIEFPLNGSQINSSTVVIRGNASGSVIIKQVIVNNLNATDLRTNFTKWATVLNLNSGLNVINVDVIYGNNIRTNNILYYEVTADTNAFPKSVDRPDNTYNVSDGDNNNDGIDGMIDNALFVSKFGNDSNSGNITHPKLSINTTIQQAKIEGKDVYISLGLYNESLTVLDGVSIYGGYNETDFWTRDETNSPIINSTDEVNNRVIGISATSISTLTFIDNIEIHAGDSNGSSYGIYCNDITNYNLIISNCKIYSGNGGNGANGVSGPPGQSGGNGYNGANGQLGQGGLGGAGGAGGGNVGGGGGNGGVGNNNGSNGMNGTGSPVGGIGGAFGNSSGVTGSDGEDGQNGNDGANGVNGAGGLNGTGYISDGYWHGCDGQNGTDGEDGEGGMGGGGGGGYNNLGIEHGGGGGGGGGAGGAGGKYGHGGKAGVGSIGIFVFSSNVCICNNNITTGNGGSGGNGGNGGSGGSGGSGGQGGTPYGSAYYGGRGGNGGNGGSGGHGGGGAGGISCGIFLSGDSLVNNLNNNTYNIGNGGSGGLSSGNNGPSGISVNYFPP